LFLNSFDPPPSSFLLNNTPAGFFSPPHYVVVLGRLSGFVFLIFLGPIFPPNPKIVSSQPSVGVDPQERLGSPRGLPLLLPNFTPDQSSLTGAVLFVFLLPPSLCLVKHIGEGARTRSFLPTPPPPFPLLRCVAVMTLPLPPLIVAPPWRLQERQAVRASPIALPLENSFSPLSLGPAPQFQAPSTRKNVASARTPCLSWFPSKRLVSFPRFPPCLNVPPGGSRGVSLSDLPGTYH